MKLILLFFILLSNVFLSSCTCTHNSCNIDYGYSPTCTKEGCTDGSHCEVCGKIIVPQYLIPPLGHEIVVDNMVEPNCTESGLSEGSHCSRCGEIIVAQTIIDPLGHKEVIDSGYEATCCEPGLTDGIHCEICEQILVQQEVVQPLGHSPVIVPAVMPTIRKSGLTEYTICSRCKMHITEPETIPALEQATVKFIVDSNKGTFYGQNVQILGPKDYLSPVKVIANKGYKFSGWSDGTQSRIFDQNIEIDAEFVANFVEEDNDIPLISINTESGKTIDSREEWLKCDISTSFCDSKFEVSGLTGKIKGRGHSSWAMPKKSYKFKLDKKEDLFGLGKAKNWVLIANYCDPSSIRNYLALNCGKQIDNIKDATTDNKFVELEVNGEYYGLYNLVEQIEINTNRIDITKDSPNDDTGFIVEIDFRASEDGVLNKDYFVMGGINYAIKDPDTDDELTEGQMSFITNYFNTAYNALTVSYDELKKYIDVDSFASTYIVQELFKTVDVGCASFYFYKDANGKIMNGPLWDFDIAVGNCNYSETSIKSDYLYARVTNPWYYKLCSYPEFRNLIGQKLNEYKEKIISCIESSINFCYEHGDSFYRNFNLWKTIGVYVWPNSQEIVYIKTWEGNVEYVRDWLNKSFDFIVKSYPYQN